MILIKETIELKEHQYKGNKPITSTLHEKNHCNKIELDFESKQIRITRNKETIELEEHQHQSVFISLNCEINF